MSGWSQGVANTACTDSGLRNEVTGTRILAVIKYGSSSVKQEQHVRGPSDHTEVHTSVLTSLDSHIHHASY